MSVEVEAVAYVTEHGASRPGLPVGDAAWANALKLCVATVEQSKAFNIARHKAGLRVVEAAKEKLRGYMADEGRRLDLTALRQKIDDATSSIKITGSSQGCVVVSVAQHAATWAKLVAELDRITASASEAFKISERDGLRHCEACVDAAKSKIASAQLSQLCDCFCDVPQKLVEAMDPAADTCEAVGTLRRAMQKRPLFAAMTPTTETKLDRVLSDKDRSVAQARLDHAKAFLEAVTVFVDNCADHDFRKIDICCPTTVELFDGLLGRQAFDLDEKGLPDEWVPSNAFALGKPLRALMSGFMKLALDFQSSLATSALSSVIAAFLAALKPKKKTLQLLRGTESPNAWPHLRPSPPPPVRRSSTPPHLCFPSPP